MSTLSELRDGDDGAQEPPFTLGRARSARTHSLFLGTTKPGQSCRVKMLLQSTSLEDTGAGFGEDGAAGGADAGLGEDGATGGAGAGGDADSNCGWERCGGYMAAAGA
mmetsp:Transcript_91574/g.172478  ORF Transcript_91574/g.172478 Transcript_91574/m.172478 type:complete len:108 (+) Transcript_91574:676-999(+)